jgi:hypothetical protein
MLNFSFGNMKEYLGSEYKFVVLSISVFKGFHSVCTAGAQGAGAP